MAQLQSAVSSGESSVSSAAQIYLLANISERIDIAELEDRRMLVEVAMFLI